MTDLTTIAGDRPAIIGNIVYAATTREPMLLEGASALQLLDYLRELEAIAREYADRQRDGTAGLRAPVLAFAWLMEHKLRKHDADRGRDGWRQGDPDALMQHLEAELDELEVALDEWNRPEGGQPAPHGAAYRLALEAADVANLAMMVADRAGGLVGIGPGQPRKRHKRLRHMHRMLERLLRVIELRSDDGITPQSRIVWLHADRKALEYALHQLDPYAEHRGPMLHGDGTGDPLPAVESGNQALEAPATGRPLEPLPAAVG